MLSDKIFPSESHRAVHSQKVAINIKITLLNNKYVSEYGDTDLFEEPCNTQSQSAHTFQCCQNAAEETRWRGPTHTLQVPACQPCSGIGPRIAESTNSRFLDLLSGIHDYSYFWRLNKGSQALKNRFPFSSLYHLKTSCRKWPNKK